MLVDDDVEVQAATASMLIALEYTVHQAKDADSALSILKEKDAIAVLLTDVVISGSMDGLALAQR